MTYPLSLKQHFRIWFSYHPGIGINETNKRRLIAFRAENPGITITLVYSSDLLTEAAHTQLLALLTEHRIQPLNIPLKRDEDVAAFLAQDFTEEDQELYELAREELLHLDDYGNPAVASDQLRLVFLEKLRIYADLDTKVVLPAGAENITIEVRVPLLYPQAAGGFNNDVLMLADPSKDPDKETGPSREAILKHIKRKMIESCRRPHRSLLNIIAKVSQNPPLGEHTLTRVLLMFNQSPSFMAFLASKNENLFPMRLLIKEVMRLCEHPHTYLNAFLPDLAPAILQSPEKCVKMLMQIIKNTAPTLTTVNLDTFLAQSKQNLLMTLIPVISGSLQISSSLTELDPQVEVLKNMGFYKYSLHNYPVLEQSFAESLVTNEAGGTSDLSWTPEGRKNLEAADRALLKQQAQVAAVSRLGTMAAPTTSQSPGLATSVDPKL
ncbi:MAG: hypothetical protein NTW08_02545 [Gammaproteobacteria bacterium]|nr:hypothetical protein [Gammaproteobacteria bacterium]